MFKRQTKKKAHYCLDYIKNLITQGNFYATGTAKNNAREDFNISASEIHLYVLKLETTDFYHSMTCDNDNKIWQDVYHSKITSKDIAYIKLQINQENSVIIQFKRK